MKFPCQHCAAMLETAEEMRGLRSVCPQCGRITQAPSVARVGSSSGPERELPGSTEWIHWPCQNCGADLSGPASMAGRRGPCPKCQAPTQMPSPAVALRAALASAQPTASTGLEGNKRRGMGTGIGSAEIGSAALATGKGGGLVAADDLSLGGLDIEQSRNGAGEAGGRSSAARRELVSPEGAVGEVAGDEFDELGPAAESVEPLLIEVPTHAGLLRVFGVLLLTGLLGAGLFWGWQPRADAQRLERVRTAELQFPEGSGELSAEMQQQLSAGQEAQQQLAQIVAMRGRKLEGSDDSLVVLRQWLAAGNWAGREPLMIFANRRYEALAAAMFGRSLPLDVRGMDSRWQRDDGGEEVYWLVQEVPPGFLRGLDLTLPRGQFLVALQRTAQGWKVRGDELVQWQSRALETRLAAGQAPVGTAVGADAGSFAVALRRVEDGPGGSARLELLSYRSPSSALGVLPWRGEEALPTGLVKPDSDLFLATVELAWVPSDRSTLEQAVLGALPLPRLELAIVRLRLGPWGGPGHELP